ncbi:MAG: diacylglycerol kinase family lipid kinase [Bacilli bacterium]|nr:diacylglycerol kinase family lipid kinase [Bacilli bacterium]
MKKCVIILNPESGKKHKIKTYEEFYDTLRKYGYETEIILTKAKGDAEKIIQGIDKSIDLVISGGGDGTLNEIVSGNLQREKPLTIAPLPMGSTNDVGNMYGLNRSVFENLEILLKGKQKKVDVCYINKAPFAYVACLGDYIDMAYATPRSLKKKYGKIAYILYGIGQLRNKIHQYKLKYTIDGKSHEGTYSFIFISNSSRIAGQPDVYYDVKLDDNMFEVALANVKNKAEMLRLLVLTSTMDVKDIPGITYYQTNNFEIEFIDKPKTSWCIDGEEYKINTNKFVFHVEQNMKMQVPKESAKTLFDE